MTTPDVSSEIEADDEHERVSEGTHERFVVDIDVSWSHPVAAIDLDLDPGLSQQIVERGLRCIAPATSWTSTSPAPNHSK